MIVGNSNKIMVVAQGAVESVLARTSHIQLADGCDVPMDEACRQLVLSRHMEMSSKGLRCLGLAYKDDLGELSDYDGEHHPSHKKLLDPTRYVSIETDLIFVGVVVGLRDPPRAEVKSAIEECGEAGIKVLVITGDYKSTAEAICSEIGLFYEGEDLRGKSFTGKEFIGFSTMQQRDILSKPGGKVFSRAEPRHKQEIVRMLKEWVKS